MFLNLLLLLLIVLANADEEEDETDIGETGGGLKGLLYRRMMEQVRDAPKAKKKKALQPQIYKIPGPQEPLPGRSHDSDYWPVYPFQNQYSGGLDLDPSISRHIGGDLNIAVPSWGIMDIYGRFFNRISDTTTKFGYLNHPVNMMDLEKEDLVELITDPSAQWNREQQPRLPLGKLAKNYVPLNCRPPLCNPYHANFALGIEHDLGGRDGVEGDIDVPIPISKGVAYRMPFSGNVYYDLDNITVTYGHNLAPIDPYTSLFEYQKYRDPALAIPRHTDRRRKRSMAAGPTRVNDADGVDSNEVDDVNDLKKTWKNFEIDPNASITMPRAEFVRMMQTRGMQLRSRAQRDYMQRMQQQRQLQYALYARAEQEAAWREMQKAQYARALQQQRMRQRVYLAEYYRQQQQQQQQEQEQELQQQQQWLQEQNHRRVRRTAAEPYALREGYQRQQQRQRLRRQIMQQMQQEPLKQRRQAMQKGALDDYRHQQMQQQLQHQRMKRAAAFLEYARQAQHYRVTRAVAEQYALLEGYQQQQLQHQRLRRQVMQHAVLKQQHLQHLRRRRSAEEMPASVSYAPSVKDNSEDEYWKKLKNFETEPKSSTIPSEDAQRMMTFATICKRCFECRRTLARKTP